MRLNGNPQIIAAYGVASSLPEASGPMPHTRSSLATSCIALCLLDWLSHPMADKTYFAFTPHDGFWFHGPKGWQA